MIKDMINNKANPVEWSSLMYELDDAKEHLEALINEMAKNGQIDEVDYQIQISHILAHLNRSWNTRSQLGEFSDKKRELFTQFPTDIEPSG